MERPIGWAERWQREREEQEDSLRGSSNTKPTFPTVNIEKIHKGDPEDHIVDLVRLDFQHMLNDIGHGKFSLARETLIECREKFKDVLEKKPELLSELDEIDSILTMRTNDLSAYANSDPEVLE